MASKKVLIDEGEAGGTIYKDQGRNARSTLRCALAMTSASFAMSIFTFAVLILFYELNYAPVAESDQIILANHPAACLPCLKLLRDLSRDALQDPLLQKLDRKIVNNEEICCAYTSDQMSVMFQSAMKLSSNAQVLPQYNVSDFKFSPVSAHKRIIPKKKNEDDSQFNSQSQACEFEPDDPRYGVEHHRGVEISKTGLKILYGGLYYVYTSIQFRSRSPRPCQEFPYKASASYVMRYNANQRGLDPLLKASYTCCETCTSVQETRFVGGLFVLNPGDEIQVSVSGYELVAFNAYSSFLGLVMLGGGPLLAQSNV
ncbi:tumor necrosis factor ligand superfamily member 6 [Plakobranchus ocellatus]|uniref:Tumor necrosis factor ligand superfamily member 6 n=1 Tax=Plakobranchus ocellatus TaxID=259542 RepID=A0AAV4DVH0_9GAST|nr:tumor necrosis factor ligand superfamily member 6 [Plakobranchus ocellatus]